MSTIWDEYAEGWDSNEAVVAFSDKAFATLQNIVNLHQQRVLDFGCGTGLLTERIAKYMDTVVALDPSQKMISVLDRKQLTNVTTIAEELDQQLIKEREILKPGFDLIVASSSLAFVPDYLDSLQLLSQLLNKGGTLIQWDWHKMETQPGVGFSEQQLESAFQKSGFSKYTTSIPFSMTDQTGSMQVIMGVAYKH